MFYYFNNFLKNDDLNKLKTYLENTKDFKKNPKCSNTYNSGRLQKWYHKNNEYFCPLWKTRYDWLESFTYDKHLLYIQDLVQNKINSMNLNTTINSCLINKYRNGNDYISAHRESKLSFGDNPIICVLSYWSRKNIKIYKNRAKI